MDGSAPVFAAQSGGFLFEEKTTMKEDEFYVVRDERAAESVRREIEKGKVTFEEMAAIIDSIAVARTRADVWRESGEFDPASQAA